MCSNGAPPDLVKHVVLTEFLVKSSGKEPSFAVKVSFFHDNFRIGSTEDLLHFCLYSISNILYKHHYHNNLVTK